jgi:hypothetical protein
MISGGIGIALQVVLQHDFTRRAGSRFLQTRSNGGQAGVVYAYRPKEMARLIPYAGEIFAAWRGAGHWRNSPDEGCAFPARDGMARAHPA